MIKKAYVIGNNTHNSLSPTIFNYWFQKYKVNAEYNYIEIKEENFYKEIKTILEIPDMCGFNVTVPFKKFVIPFLDQLTPLAKKTQSVNTLFKKDNQVIGDNTDIGGFEQSLKHINYDVKNKNVFILGAGGVVSSIILVLKKLGVSKISLSNRTKEKAKDFKKMYSDLEIIDWGGSTDFDMIINATSLGLKNDDQIKLEYSKVGSNKLFFDVIYNPSKTNFLLKAEKLGNQIINGKMMFIYQAQLSFEIWHGISPKINNKTVNLLND